MDPCVKVIGADFELANALTTADGWGGNVAEAARLLLVEIPGYPRQRWGGSAIEWGRRFLRSCGGSAYIDSDHLEINLPEHTRAEDHAALLHAGLGLARAAQVAASRKLASGSRLNVLANVSDGHQSWGHHLNLMVGREFFHDLLYRKPHLAGFVATHLATAPLFTGQGQVGPGNHRSWCDYQLSQRADWFTEFASHDTMQQRGLLNLRDEPHAGARLARLHLIPFDLVLCPTANYLLTGTTQLVLAMAEAGWVDLGLLLDDPLAAFHAVSRDLSLRQPLAMAQRGRTWTAVDVQKALADRAGEFVTSGPVARAVPGAAAIVARWQQLLELLRQRDLAALARHCDWALKYLLLDRQVGRKGVSWRSPEMKCLDLRFASLDPEEGLFWRMAAAGQVEGMPAPEQVERFLQEPPDDTRAYLRAHVLRRYGDEVVTMNWDRIRFRVRTDRYWSTEAMLVMPDPAGFGRVESEPLLGRCESLHDLIEEIGTSSEQESEKDSPSWRSLGWGAKQIGYQAEPKWPRGSDRWPSY
jgi:proteasome accessory factor A